MTRKPSLAALKEEMASERRPARPVMVEQIPSAEPDKAGQGGRVIRGKRYPTYREGKVPVGGYFSPELSRSLHQLALDESELGKPRVKVQALIGEAIDLLLRDRGKSPFGER